MEPCEDQHEADAQEQDVEHALSLICHPCSYAFLTNKYMEEHMTELHAGGTRGNHVLVNIKHTGLRDIEGKEGQIYLVLSLTCKHSTSKLDFILSWAKATILHLDLCLCVGQGKGTVA